jgi:hypothetical protein
MLDLNVVTSDCHAKRCLCSGFREPAVNTRPPLRSTLCDVPCVTTCEVMYIQQISSVTLCFLFHSRRILLPACKQRANSVNIAYKKGSNFVIARKKCVK